jgi:hypothetical protein
MWDFLTQIFFFEYTHAVVGTNWLGWIKNSEVIQSSDAGWTDFTVALFEAVWILGRVLWGRWRQLDLRCRLFPFYDGVEHVSLPFTNWHFDRGTTYLHAESAACERS